MDGLGLNIFARNLDRYEWRTELKRANGTKVLTKRRTLTRRDFLRLTGLGAGALALGGCGARTGERSRIRAYALQAAPVDLEVGGREVRTWAYDGGVPGPEIRVTEGDTLRVRVSNGLPAGTTIHWHGQPVVNGMDGVPGVTQPSIEPGEEFTYEFVVPASGSYIYHSHAGLQLDRGLYGPLIVEPKNETLSYDREYTLLLDDWLDGVQGTPEDAMEMLKAGADGMEGMEGMPGMEGMEGMGGMGGDVPSRWPPDIVYPLYLINGRPPEAPEEFEVRRGEVVRLRLMNPSAATIFRVALAGHRMTVTHADGQPVEPVEVDAVRIGMGERYDVLVEAGSPGAWQLAAQAEGTEKMARAVLRYEGSVSASPPPAGGMPPELKGRLLTYGMLRAAPGAETLPEGATNRTVPLALGGDEKRYVWAINGQRFPDADKISVGKDDRVRFEYRNETMMPHPMHLHGHFFRVDNGTGEGPIKDTVLVEPMQGLAVDWIADNPGEWALHCHQVYHQEAGMMRVVKVS
jgi:FtsP/CotA-like multicopper oxidase with cupredoxin domain